MAARVSMQAEPTADSAPRSGRRWLALIALALLAAGLRLYRIELPGLTSDEAFSWRLSSYELQELMRRATGENGPPLYAVLLRLWSLGAGDSATALRGLSALFGVLSVLAAFRLVRAALDGAASATSALAGTAAAALVAIHAGQVLQGRNARMYALGILLTASSGLLLLRCLREPRRIGPWLAYAVCAAAFLYVHYYAAFTLAAQGLFALADAMSRRSDATRLAATVRGLSAAGLVVLVLYLPWLPAMREQSQRLGEVPAAAASGLDLVPLWALGFRPPAGLAPLAVIGVLVVLGWAAAHGRAARFFLLQAALPWMIGVSWSLISGRAVLRDRYLVFAQFSLLCLTATVLAARRPGAWRAAGVAAAIALAGFGLSREARRLYPDEPHALVKATRFLGREAGPADVVLTDSPRTLNKIVYYAAHQGLSGVRVRCALDLIDPEQEDHTHLAVLRQDDLLAGTPLPGREASRLWRVITRPLPERQVIGWARVWERSFSGGERSSVTLVRLEPADATRRER